MSDELTLLIGQHKIAGWQSVRVTRGIERCPSDFDISLTERFPGQAAAVVVQPGDACQVFIGADLVITGYVDKFIASIASGQHQLRVTGRGKAQDLVDCSAEWPGGQVPNSTALEIARKLAAVYGITVNGLSGKLIKQFNIMFGETAFDIIERICRYSQLLVYDEPDGNIVLTQVGTTRAASGFVEGINVEQAQAVFAMDQRFSEYDTSVMSMALLNDLGVANYIQFKAYDPAVPRHRLRYLIVESGDEAGFPVSKARGEWEAARRAGRGNHLTVTTDGWRDSSGILWTPNTLAPLQIPSCKIVKQEWIIADVTYQMDDNGRHATLTVMPPAAFSPQPIVLYPQYRDIDQALDNGAQK